MLYPWQNKKSHTFVGICLAHLVLSRLCKNCDLFQDFVANTFLWFGDANFHYSLNENKQEPYQIAIWNTFLSPQLWAANNSINAWNLDMYSFDPQNSVQSTNLLFPIHF